MTDETGSEMVAAASSEGSASDHAMAAVLAQLEHALNLSNAYPTQVTEVPEPGLGAAPDVGAYGRTVQAAVRGLLGKLPDERRDTPETFVALLHQKFEAVQLPGHIEYRLARGASLAGIVQRPEDVTAAQERLIRRADETRNVVPALLAELQPLDPAADPEDVEAIRAVVSTDVDTLLGELVRLEGPRSPRLRTLFKQLKDDELPAVQRYFGLGRRAHIMTLEEERNETRFETIRSYLGELREAFNIYERQRGRFFGALPFLFRALQAVDEAVDSVEGAMDSVAFTEADRNITCPDPEDPQLTIAEIFDYIRQLASSEARTLVERGGRIGAALLGPRFFSAQELVAGIQSIEAIDALRHPRVTRRLDELQAQLAVARDLARRLSPPEGPQGSGPGHIGLDVRDRDIYGPDAGEPDMNDQDAEGDPGDDGLGPEDPRDNSDT